MYVFWNEKKSTVPASFAAIGHRSIGAFGTPVAKPNLVPLCQTKPKFLTPAPFVNAQSRRTGCWVDTASTRVFLDPVQHRLHFGIYTGMAWATTALMNKMALEC